jgi:hypothetical protein
LEVAFSWFGYFVSIFCSNVAPKATQPFWTSPFASFSEREGLGLAPGLVGEAVFGVPPFGVPPFEGVLVGIADPDERKALLDGAFNSEPAPGAHAENRKMPTVAIDAAADRRLKSTRPVPIAN